MERLQATGVTPQVLAVDEAQRSVLMSFVGEPLSPQNCPVDWEEQLEKILGVLQAHNCQHSDLSESAVMVQEGRLRLVDFGGAYFLEDAKEKESHIRSKRRVFNDSRSLDYFRFFMNPPPPGGELHCMVLWDERYYPEVTVAIDEHFIRIREIRYLPELALAPPFEGFQNFLNTFYQRTTQENIYGMKAKTPFIVFVVQDPTPGYGLRKGLFTNRLRWVNATLFDFKTQLREFRSNIFHASNSLDEAYQNLKHLTFGYQTEPLACFERWRPRYENVQHFLAVLEALPDVVYHIEDEDYVKTNVTRFRWQRLPHIRTNRPYYLRRMLGAIQADLLPDVSPERFLHRPGAPWYAVSIGGRNLPFRLIYDKTLGK